MVTIKLDYKEFAMGYAENYSVKVFIDGDLAGGVNFTHSLIEHSGDGDEADFVEVNAFITPDLHASSLMLISAVVPYLMAEVETRDLEVIENLFDSVGSEIEWVNPPKWLRFV